MRDVCWIHNKYFSFGDQCPDCKDREIAYKRSFVEDESRPDVKKREPGDRMWGIVKMLLLFNVALWVVIILAVMIAASG